MVMVLLFLLTLLAEPTTTPAYQTFHEPGGHWSVQIPWDWTTSDRFARRGIFQFNAPAGELQMTISRVSGLVLPDQPESSMLDMAFPDAEPVNQPQVMRGEGWIGLSRTYVGKDSEKTHIGLVAMREDALVLVTVSKPTAFADEDTQTIASILARLRLLDPPPTTAPAR
jgi:hypothetical protein